MSVSFSRRGRSRGGPRPVAMPCQARWLNGLAVHAEGFQDPLPDYASRNPDRYTSSRSQPSQLVAGVGVVVAGAFRFPGNASCVSASRVALVAAAGAKSVPARQAGGMAQQVTECDRAVAGGQGQPGQVRADGRVDVEAAGRRQLQQRQAVMDLPMLPIWKVVSGSAGLRAARSAYPTPAVNRVCRCGPSPWDADRIARCGSARKPALQVFGQGREVLRNVGVRWEGHDRGWKRSNGYDAEAGQPFEVPPVVAQ